jgi:hypothetical protein
MADDQVVVQSDADRLGRRLQKVGHAVIRI